MSKKLKCGIKTLYYTIRYGIARFQLVSGHNFVGTGEVHEDHWEMYCTECGAIASSEVRP